MEYARISLELNSYYSIIFLELENALSHCRISIHLPIATDFFNEGNFHVVGGSISSLLF